VEEFFYHWDSEKLRGQRMKAGTSDLDWEYIEETYFQEGGDFDQKKNIEIKPHWLVALQYAQPVIEGHFKTACCLDENHF